MLIPANRFSRMLVGGTLLGLLGLPAGCEAPAVPAGRPAQAPQRHAIAAADTPSSWPKLFGPGGDSVSRDRDVTMDWGDAGPTVMWRRAVGLGYSAPVVLGNRLVLFYREGDEEVLECAAAATGATQWTFRYPTAYRCPVNYSSGPYSTPVLEEQAESAGPGRPAVGGFGAVGRPAPNAVGGFGAVGRPAPNGAGGERRVYAWGAEGRLHCLDLDRGTLCWSRSLHEEYPVEPGLFPVAASPLLVGERVIVNLGARAVGAGVVALDKRTGRTLWTATQDGPSCATPAAATIHGRESVFVWTAQHLTALEPASGRIGWQIPFSANLPEKIHATSPLVAGDVVLVSGYHVGCLCVRVLPDGRYEELWRGGKEYLDSHYNNLVCVDGYVYGFGTVRGGLRCVELATGRLAWTWKSRLRNAASIAVGSRLLLFDERGRLASVRVGPDSYEPGAMTAGGLLAGPCFTAPALSRGRLYVRNEAELLCLDLRRLVMGRRDGMVFRSGSVSRSAAAFCQPVTRRRLPPPRERTLP